MPAEINYRSPIGNIYISSDGENITCISFREEEISDNPDDITKECSRQLDEYFSGSRRKFEIGISQPGTEFQKNVWHSLCSIEYGKISSYNNLSKMLGNVKAIRAVGNANGRNNIAIVVPCHRIIGSNGDLIGYSGKLWRKKWLLEHEASIANGVQKLF